MNASFDHALAPLGDHERIRAGLHRVIDEFFDKLTFETVVGASMRETEFEEPPVRRNGRVEAFHYQWPDRYEEYFDDVHLFTIDSPSGRREVALARTTRKAWGLQRDRVVVFDPVGGSDRPRQWYPWSEFTGTDDGRLASPIPDPARPRAVLRDGDPLPVRYLARPVERADSLFESIENGPSLRLVVEQDDEEEMVRHGYWVARQRKRAT